MNRMTELELNLIVATQELANSRIQTKTKTHELALYRTFDHWLEYKATCLFDSPLHMLKDDALTESLSTSFKQNGTDGLQQAWNSLKDDFKSSPHKLVLAQHEIEQFKNELRGYLAQEFTQNHTVAS